MLSCLCVGIGGFVGSVLRYLIGTLSIETASGFPVKTFVINIVGAFVLGVVAQTGASFPAVPREVVLMLQVGLCGGFTTFSTFSSEALTLLSQDHMATAFFYMIASMTLGLAAVFAGGSLVKLF